MAETVRIEIPITVKDNTSAGVQSATRTMSKFESSMKKTEQQLSKLDKSHAVKLNAEDNATGVIDEAESAATKFGGMSETATLNVEDDASAEVDEAIDELADFGGTSEEAEMSVEDDATPDIEAAIDEMSDFGGMSETATINVDDSATPEIEQAIDAGSDFEGSTFTATLALVDEVTEPLTQIVTLLSSPIATMATMLGVTVGVVDTVDTYSGFEAQMSQVEALSGASEEEMELLTAKAKELGSTTKFTATESAEAFNYMAMAGWDAEEMIGGIEGILSLAAAAGEDLGTTSDIVTDALTAFGMSASDAGEFANVLAVAASSSNTTVSKMGETFKYAGAMSGTLGYSIQDVALMTGLMANSGIKSTMAGTALNMTFTRLSTNTGNARDAIENLGIAFFDETGAARDLSDVIEELRAATADMTDEEKASLANKISGTQAQKGLLAILNASEEDYYDLKEAIEDADGAAADMSDTMMDNLAGSITLLQSALEGVKDTLGERMEPYLSTFVDGLTALMPTIEEKITGIMDKFDGWATGIKRELKSAMKSDEWLDGNLFDKIDIAWDTIIWEPFKEWIGSSGKDLIADGIKSLFSNAFAILPGGEEAGLSSWLSAAILTKGVTKILNMGSSFATKLSPLTSGLRNLGGAMKYVGTAAATAPSVTSFFSDIAAVIPSAGKYAIIAAAIAAGITAIVVAVRKYNSAVKESSLDSRFGDIELSAAEIEDAAEGILNAEYLVDVDLALDEITNAEEFQEDAEEALESAEKLMWKSSVGIELTTDEQDELVSDMESYVESTIEEIESRAYAATISVDMFIDEDEAEGLSAGINEWLYEDELELNELSEQLTTALQEALEDGVIDVDEASIVAELQQKIASIESKWAEAEQEAEMDWLTQSYGSLSGEELTADTFTEIVEALQEQRESANEDTEELAKDFYSYLNAAEQAGRLSSDTVERYKEMASEAIRNMDAENIATSVDFETTTLTDTYGDVIEENVEEAQEAVQSQMDTLSKALEMGDMFEFKSSLVEGSDDAASGTGLFAGIVTDADQAAMSDLWDTLKPDAEELTAIIDEYAELGQEVPQQIMDSFNEAMEVGAAAGDYDSSLQVWATSLAESGDQAIIDAINEMGENGELSDEFADAWARATAEVTAEGVTLDSLTTQVSEVEVNTEGAEVTVDESGVSGTTEGSSLTTEETVTVNASAEVGTIDTSLVLDGTITELDALYKEPIDTEGDVDVSLSETNNSDEVYENVDDELQSTMASGFSATAPVKVTLDYSIVNANKTLSLSGAANATANITATFNAAGGKVGENGAELSWLGEEGVEYVIPTVAGRRSRGIDLWAQAGNALGVLDETGLVSQHASGGVIGGSETNVSLPTGEASESDETTWSVTGQELSGSSSEEGSTSLETTQSGNVIEVKVDLSPVITIEGTDMDEDKIFEVMKDRIREVADDLGDEIATRMSDVFSNMPLAKEA